MFKEGAQWRPILVRPEVNPLQDKVESGILFEAYLPTFRESFKRARMFEQVKQELLTIGSGIGNELPPNFKSYLRDFPERFGGALRTSPMDVLFQNESNRWNINFFTTLNNVDNACARERICGHGLDHISHVAQNAFALADTIPDKYRDGVISDENLTLAALVHDLGYADKNVIWKNYEALGHDKKSSEWLSRKLRRNLKPLGSFSTLADFTNYFKRSLLGNPKLESLFYKTIKFNNKEEIIPLVESTVDPTVYSTSEDLFMHTIFLADKLDYFRTERVEAEGVERPDNYETNPYFFQADAVEEYTITSDDFSLYYNVKIKETDIPKENDLTEHVDFNWWKGEIERNYGWILGLGKSYAKRLGKEFVTRELTTREMTKLSNLTPQQVFPQPSL
jgi:hypothetical protein